MMRIAFSLSAVAALVLTSGCAGPVRDVFGLGGDRAAAAPAPESVTLPELAAPPPPVGATSAEALDTTTEEQRAAATAVPTDAGGAELGKVTVSLGDPTAAGFWLRTALVSAPAQGRVATAGGASVQVELRPGEGAAQLSLAAFRALNLPLTALPEITVFRQ